MIVRKSIRDAMLIVLANSDCQGPKMIFSHEEAREIIAALDAPRAPMTEDEILQRARRAVVALIPSWTDKMKDQCLRGEYDADNLFVHCAIAALRDLDKPLVDPAVVLACRKIVAADAPEEVRQSVLNGDWDKMCSMKAAVAAYYAGQAA